MTRHKSYFQAAKMQKTGYRSFHVLAKVRFQDAHFKGMCRSRLTLTFDLSLRPRIWSFRMTFELLPWIKAIGEWGSLLGINRIFRPPNCGKRASGRFTKRMFPGRPFHRPASFAFELVLWPFTLARIWSFRVTFDLWPRIKTIGQWGLWLGINRIFRPSKCRKRATGRLTKRKKYVSRTPISKACFVRVWPWPLTFHPGHESGLFAWPLNIDLEINYWAVGFMTRHKSYFQAAKMLKTGYGSFHETAKVRFHDAHFKGLCRSRFTLTLTFHPGLELGLFAWPLNYDLEINYWTVGYIPRHKSHFQAAKMQKTGYRSFHETAKLRYTDANSKWVGLCLSRLILTFDLSLCPRIWSFRMTFELWPWNKTIGPWGSWIGINRIFRPPKCRKRAKGRFTKRQKYVSRTPISKACVVRVWLWPLIFHPGHEFGRFEWPLNFDLQLKLLDKMQQTGYRSFHETANVRFQVAHFKGLCRSRLTLTFELSTWRRVWSLRMTFELCLWIKSFGLWGSWLGINRIFRPPKCRKRASGCFTKRMFPGRPFQRPVSFAFDLYLWPFTLATNLVFSHDLWTLTLK